MSGEPRIVQATVSFTGQGGLGEEVLTFKGEALSEHDTAQKAEDIKDQVTVNTCSPSQLVPSCLPTSLKDW